MNPTTSDDWEELRAAIEDGTMRFSVGEPDVLVLKLADGFTIEYSLAEIVDDVIDTIETFGQMDGAREVGEHLERLGKRVKRTLQDMEAS